MRTISLYVSLIFMAFCSTLHAQQDGQQQYQPFSPDGVPFCVASQDWNPDQLGNHRAVVTLPAADAAKPACVELKWRRPDSDPARKDVLVIAATSGKRIEQTYVETCTSQLGVVWFQPLVGEQTYYLYYMPYHKREGSYDARYEPGWYDYLTYDFERGNTWKSSLGNAQPITGQVQRYESRNNFEFLTPMGLIATKAETEKMRTLNPQNPVLFTEDRTFPIRLPHRLPARWVSKGTSLTFQGTAQRNEYYVWQIGVWAAHSAIQDVHVTFSDLKCGADVIPAEQQTCFNQEGTNWDDKPLQFHVNVAENDVQALWCGVQIPADAKPGDYQGTVQVQSQGNTTQTIQLTIHVENGELADHGDNDLWRMSRLRWLNSRIGTDDHMVAPFQAMKLHGHTIQASEKTMKVIDNGMPSSIVVNKREVLSQPMSFRVITDNGTVSFTGGKLQISRDADGLVTWTSEQEQNGFHLSCTARMEYDGYVNYQLHLSASSSVTVRDIQFQTPYTSYASKYIMGIGLDGGANRGNHRWDWTGPYDSYWMGNTLAGLHVEFRGGAYHGPLISDYKPAPPATWSNQGKGYIQTTSESSNNQSCLVTAHTGQMQIDAQGKTFEFALNITPTKPVDTHKQFSMRFYHGSWRHFDNAAKEGANICNIHHATDLNPVINYPFIVQDSLKAFIQHEHEQGRRVKLYYTVRELTDHIAEIYALKSLGSEIMQDGNGGGAPWLCEHLIDHYRGAWYVSLKNGLVDAAFMTATDSRWFNYWLEGLRWMLENYQIDGIYMDDVSFDRTIMKRIRKIMAQYRPDAIIDLHSNTGYSHDPSNQYTDFFPYVDRLWFGESFRYNKISSDQWLVSFSGIPFGPMSEMLQDGGNRYLGTLFGATTRHSTSAVSPAPMWKLWQEFSIQDARMIGFWDENCPVQPTGNEVQATVFLAKKKALVAIGNFSDTDQDVTLNINWKALHLNLSKVRITQPEIKDYQTSATLNAKDVLHIKAKEGRVLLLEE